MLTVNASPNRGFQPTYGSVMKFTPFFYELGKWSDGVACNFMYGASFPTTESTPIGVVKSAMDYTDLETITASGSTQKFEIFNPFGVGFSRFIGVSAAPYLIENKSLTFPSKNAASQSWQFAVKLDSTRVLFLYEQTNSFRAVVGTLTGDTMALGTDVQVIGTAGVNDDIKEVDAKLIGTDKVVVSYATAGLADAAAVVLTFSGSTITVNTPTTFTIAATTLNGTGVAKLSTDKFLLCVGSSSANECEVVVGTIDGSNNITFGTGVIKDITPNLFGITMEQLDTDVVAIAGGSTSSSVISSLVVTVSGTTPTIGVEVVTGSGETSNGKDVQIIVISTTKWLLQTNAYLYLYTRSGTTITLQDTETFPFGAQSSYGFGNIATGGYYYIYTSIGVSKWSESGNVLTAYNPSSISYNNTVPTTNLGVYGFCPLSSTEILLYSGASTTTTVGYSYQKALSMEFYNNATLVTSATQSVPCKSIQKSFVDSIDIIDQPLYFGVKNTTTTYSQFNNIDSLNIRLS